MSSALRAVAQSKAVKALVAIAMLLALAVTLNIGMAHGSTTKTTPTAKTLQGATSTRVAARGSVDLSKAPTIKAGKLPSVSAAQVAAVNRPLPAAQRAKATGKTAGVPRDVASAQAPSTIKPNFVGGSTVPQLTRQAEGLNSTQGGGWYPPDQAIAVGGGGVFSNQYVVEGVNNAVGIYNTNFTLLNGPYATDTIFASVKHSGDFFSDPQITYDADRVSWVIVYIELTPNGSGGISHGYIDIAVSKNISPVGVPTNYYVYQFDTDLNADNEYCDYPTLGMEYWNLYVTCATFDFATNAFLGNRTFMFSKTGMYTNSTVHWGWFYSLPIDLSCGSSNCPAYRVAPALEDGVPNAEWVVATDASYLGTSSSSQNLTLFAITNPNALSIDHLPTGTYIFGSLAGAYSDPPDAVQPGTTATVDPGAGVKQFMYKGGRLWFAFTTGVNWNGDSTTRSGVYWTDIEPYLTTMSAHNPQWASGFSNHQQGYYGYVGGYTYMGTLFPSDEGDASLVFNYSSSSVYPSIVYTGRQNADALGTMGQTGQSTYVIPGTNPNGSGRWGDYSACALNVQATTRGYVFCGGEYGGSLASASGTGWNTRMYTLRLE